MPTRSCGNSTPPASSSPAARGSSGAGTRREELMPRVADYIAACLADWGVRHVFMVTGGGAMHLNDAIGREPRLRYVCTHHEQAAAMAAEGYARVTGGVGVINGTTGPGSTNALNGLFGAWTDSIPMRSE